MSASWLTLRPATNCCIETRPAATSYSVASGLVFTRLTVSPVLAEYGAPVPSQSFWPAGR